MKRQKCRARHRLRDVDCNLALLSAGRQNDCVVALGYTRYRRICHACWITIPATTTAKHAGLNVCFFPGEQAFVTCNRGLKSSQTMFI